MVGVVAVGIDLFGDKKYSFGNDILGKSFESSYAATWLISAAAWIISAAARLKFCLLGLR